MCIIPGLLVNMVVILVKTHEIPWKVLIVFYFVC